MKLPLADVLGIANCMKRLESIGLELAPGQQVLWAITRKRGWEFVDPFSATVRKEFDALPPEEKTEEKWNQANQRRLEAINGDQVELDLPGRIRTSAIQNLQCRKSQDYEALSFLMDRVFETEPVATKCSSSCSTPPGWHATA